MKNKFLAIATLFVSSILVGCVDGIHAEANAGSSQKKSINHKGFTKIELNGSANLIVKVGSVESIAVSGSQSRIDNLESKVVDGKLVFEEKSGGLFGNHGELNITVTLPTLEAFELSGSGDVQIEGVKGNVIAVALTGSGDIDVKGESSTATLSVTGSGDLNSKGLTVKTATVSITGSGDIETNATGDLTISILGSGDVTYFGDPKVTSSINGSGNVNKG